MRKLTHTNTQSYSRRSLIGHSCKWTALLNYGHLDKTCKRPATVMDTFSASQRCPLMGCFDCTSQNLEKLDILTLSNSSNIDGDKVKSKPCSWEVLIDREGCVFAFILLFLCLLSLARIITSNEIPNLLPVIKETGELNSNLLKV